MSLSYSDYSGVSDGERLDMMDVYNMYNTINKVDSVRILSEELLLLYDSELNEVWVDEGSEESILSKLDVSFLKNVISIKRKIMSLRVDYKYLSDLCMKMEEEMYELEEMRLLYEKFSELYVSRLNKCGDKEVMNDILDRICSNKLEREKLVKKMNDILLRISRLKTIICVDDLEDDMDVSNSSRLLNDKVLCFTCNEGEVTYCFNPCGHSFCEKCVSRVSVGSANAICFMCRSKVYGKIRIYI